MHNKIFQDAVMLRTYCRDIVDKDGSWRKETRSEVFERVIKSFHDYYDSYHFVDTRDWLKLMTEGKALPAGRMLWSMGSRAVIEEGFLPLMNCGFCLVNTPVEPLRFIMKMLMLGCGMGFSLEEKHFRSLVTAFTSMRYPISPEMKTRISEEKFNPLKHSDKNYITVEDSRDGWVKFIETVVECAIRMKPLYFNVDNVRPAGSRISGFGGRSGDPRILAEIAKRIYLLITCKRYPDIEMYYDVICSIGELVVSGNVRRSALIAIGDSDNEEFLSLKKFSKLSDKPWRCFCNNSVNASSFYQLYQEYWDTYRGTSEAYGFVNIQACSAADAERNGVHGPLRIYPQGVNPCGEQPLADHELCCLSEVNLFRVESEQELLKALEMCYYFCKFSYLLGTSETRVSNVVQKNQRIGISLTGISMVSPERRQWAYNCRQKLRDMDLYISAIIRASPSIALTTVKPGGTLPKICGSAGPGIHRPISKYQIRRVRFDKRSSLLEWLKMMSVPVEPQFLFNGKPDPSGTQVASFYIQNEEPMDGHYSDWLLTEEGFEDMLALITEVQEKWSDNAVSVTVYYNLNNLDSFVIPTIHTYFKGLKTLSCLPYFGHNFPQAPEEPISEEEYYRFSREHPLSHYQELPRTCDKVTEMEDFGLCEGRAQCSERG